jgi:hypothetical protein
MAAASASSCTKLQHGDRQQGHRAGQVEEVAHAGCLEHGVGFPQVRGGDRGERVAVEQRGGRGDGDRLVVDVGHPRRRIDRPGRLVDVADRRDAGAEVEELVDPLPRAEPHGPPQEVPVGVDHLRRERHDGRDAFDGCPIGGEVVRAAQEVVVHAGGVRDASVDRWQLRQVGHGDRYCQRAPGPRA